MEFTQSSRDQNLVAILYRAILILSQTPHAAVTVTALADFIGKAGPELISAVGTADRKPCEKLAADLQSLALIRSVLFAADGPPLDVGALFGTVGPAQPEKTHLSIVCTKFLGDNPAVEFWLAQFLSSVDGWVGAHPADRLQAVLLLDEADVYFPRVRRPATRLPIERLLKRAGAAGLGTFVATDRPEDLGCDGLEDVHNWFVGRVPPGTLRENLRAFIKDDGDLAAQLAGQEPGQFTLLHGGQFQRFRADHPVLDPRPLPDDVILDLAAASRARR
jgi:hypothetical protein